MFFFSESRKSSAEIKKFHVNSKIDMGYAITDVEVIMQNIHSTKSEAEFDMMIPNEAFVSKFFMVVNGNTYHGKVMTKEEAKDTFESSPNTSALLIKSEFSDGKQVHTYIF
jgi:hypothetical protein